MIRALVILLFLVGCGRHYEVPIEVHLYFPDCADKQCLEALKEIDLSEMIHIEVDARIDRDVDVSSDLTGGKLF